MAITLRPVFFQKAFEDAEKQTAITGKPAPVSTGREALSIELQAAHAILPRQPSRLAQEFDRGAASVDLFKKLPFASHGANFCFGPIVLKNST
jgi:hypothetical protein